MAKLIDYKQSELQKSKDQKEEITETELIELLREKARKMYEGSNKEEGRLLTYAETKHNINIPDIKNQVNGTSQSLYDSIILHTKNYSLTGRGGAGKTFMIFDSIKRLLNNKNRIIPFYIPLHAFNEKAIANETANETKLIIDYLKSKMVLNENYFEQFKTWLSIDKDDCNCYPLLFLDGFNEITSDDLKSEIVTEIHKFQSKYPRIRFVIASRYDLSSQFTAHTSGELCFEQCNVNKLSERYIFEYIRNVLSECEDYDYAKINEHLHNIDPRYLEVLSTPMALAMHVKILLNENLNLDLPSKNPKTTGELIENFIFLLQRSPDTVDFRETNGDKFEHSNFILQYIGYRMNMEGIFEAERRDLNRYFDEAKKILKFSFLLEDFENFPTVKMIISFSKDSLEGKMEFVHQNFRDYFCAAFLKKALQTAYDHRSKEYILWYFREQLPKEVLVLLGEILKEYQYVGENSNMGTSFLNKTLIRCLSNIRNDDNVNVSIAQLIEISQIARENDLSNFDFTGLDLSKTRLNNNKLYNSHKNNRAVFEKAYLTEYTFRANGHAGAIFTMALVDNNYLISFSRGSIWCYDISQRIHYQIHSYSNSATEASVHIPEKKMIITGDDDGNLIIWKYTIANNDFSIEKYKDFAPYKAKIQNIVYIMEKNTCFFVSKNGNAYFFNPDTSEEPICFYYDNSGIQKIYTITADKNFVYIFCGTKISFIKIEDIIGDKTYVDNDESVVSSYQLDKPINCISYVTIRKVKGRKILFINGKNSIRRFSEIYYTVITKNGIPENTCFYSVAGSEKQWGNGFNGYNNFSLQYGSELYICGDLNNPSIPNIYKIDIDVQLNDEITARLVDCHIGTHEMSVECAIPLNLPNGNRGIATSAIDRGIEIIDFKAENIYSRLPGYFDGVHMIDINDGILYAAAYSGSVSAWKYNDEDAKWYCYHVYPVHLQNAWVWEIKQYSFQNIEYLISCSYDNTFVIFKPETEEIICRVTKEVTNDTDNINDCKVYSVIPLFNGDILAACGKTLKWFRIDYNKKRSTLIDEMHFDTEVRFLQKNQDNDTVTAILASKSIHEVHFNHESNTLYCPIIKCFKKPFVFRATDSLIKQDSSVLTVYGGSNDNEKSAYFEVYISEICTDSVCGEKAVGCRKTYGISSLALYRYNKRILLLTASYSGNVSIYDITNSGKTICRACLTHYDQVLDVMAHDGNLYCSSLDGKVFCWPIDEVLKGTDEKVKCCKAEDYNVEIFQTAAGFMMNHVDFSDAEYNWSDEYKNLIKQYHTVLDED